MRGAISLLHQYAFMAWCFVKKSTGTNLPLPMRIKSVMESHMYDVLLQSYSHYTESLFDASFRALLTLI
jgi:hypothetical protein